MTSAVDQLREQLEGPAKGYSDLKSSIPNVDLSKFLLDAVNKNGIDIDISESITDGTIERSIDQASTLTVTVHDPRRVLLNSSIWDYWIDVEVDGYFFRLVQVSKSGDDLTLTFEDRIVCWMRRHKVPLAISRSKMTRAEFIKHMVEEIKADNTVKIPIEFFSPELHKIQPIKKPKKDKHRRKTKAPGLHKKIKIHDPNNSQIDLTREQISNLERVLDVGLHMKAPDPVLIATMMCVWQESAAKTTATNGSHVGLFQQDPRYWPATRNPEKDATAFYNAILKVYKNFVGPLRLQDLVEKVQGSGQPSLYGQWEGWARGVVYKYNGGKSDPNGAPSGSYQRTYAKQYQFTRGQPGGPKNENTWQAALRLADEVRWRFFIVGNTCFYVNDDDLLKAKPVMVIDESDDGILTIDYDYDVGKRANEATITCRAERWFAHPGEVVVLQDSMGPAKGRWLVERISRPIFSENTTITLYTPRHPHEEPAHELNTVTKERKSKQAKGDGKVQIAPGANRPGVEIKQHVIDFLTEVATQTTEKIEIVTGTNHNQMSTSGLQSDHWTGDAADIGVGGDARSSKDAGKKGDNIATAAEIVCGLDPKLARSRARNGDLNFGLYSTFNWHGYRIQIGWRTLVGGNHYNHVHIGVRKI